MNDFKVFLKSLTISPGVYQFYNNKKEAIHKNYKDLINNLYFQKSVNHIFNNLSPRYKNINHKIFIHKVSSPSNKLFIVKLRSIYQLLISLLKTIFLILLNKPQVIIGFGGYPSVAPVIAAKLLKIPSIIHEQNAIIGRANKLLGKISNLLALSFFEAFLFLLFLKHLKILLPIHPL